MSDQLYDEWDAACYRVREQDAEITALKACIDRLEAEVAKMPVIVGYVGQEFIHDLKNGNDYGGRYLDAQIVYIEDEMNSSIPVFIPKEYL
jgi:hypothetical protein